MNSICKVKNCRYSEHHVTSRHKCGTCHTLGHGMIECNSKEMKDELKQYYGDIIIFNMCRVKECIDKTTHTSSGHSCRYCHKMVNHTLYCPNNGTPICDNITTHNIIQDIEAVAREKNLNKGQYFILLGGMGCCYYIRSNILTETIEYLFMHSDSWGQYGEDTSDVPRLNAFIDNYTLIENEIIVN